MINPVNNLRYVEQELNLCRQHYPVFEWKILDFRHSLVKYGSNYRSYKTNKSLNICIEWESTSNLFTSVVLMERLFCDEPSGDNFVYYKIVPTSRGEYELVNLLIKIESIIQVFTEWVDSND